MTAVTICKIVRTCTKLKYNARCGRKLKELLRNNKKVNSNEDYNLSKFNIFAQKYMIAFL